MDDLAISALLIDLQAMRITVGVLFFREDCKSCLVNEYPMPLWIFLYNYFFRTANLLAPVMTMYFVVSGTRMSDPVSEQTKKSKKLLITYNILS